MATRYHKSPKFPGVYFEDSSRHRHRGKPDRVFYINYKDSSGKLQWEKVGWVSEGYSAQLASNIRNERIQQMRHGDLPEIQARRKKLIIAALWEHYWPWVEKNRVKPGNEKSRYQNHIKPHLGDTPISALTVKTLEEYRDKLLESGLAPATVKHCLVQLRHMINKAKQWDLWVGENPVSKIKLPNPDNRRERFLSQEEASKLLEELGKRSPKLRLIALVSLRAGLRAGEIFSMRWEDLNFEGRFINVRGKGAISRQAYMTEDLAKELWQWPRSQSGYVFEGREGEKVSEVSHSFERAVEQLGLNDHLGRGQSKQRIVFHSLRHTFASWLAMAGCDIFTIKELMGHSNIEMTMRYAHLIPDRKRRFVEEIAYEL